MKNIDETTIRVLISRIKDSSAKDNAAFEELSNIYSKWIDRMVRFVSYKMFNSNRQNLIDEAKFALFQGSLNFDEIRHPSAFKYLGNYIREHLRRFAKKDRDHAFPNFTIVPSTKQNDNDEELDILNDTPSDGYLRPLVASPEQQAILVDAIDRLKTTGNTPYGKRTPCMIKVVNYLQEHPEDISITSIAIGTGLPKSTVSDAFKKIIKILTDESRTNLN